MSTDRLKAKINALRAKTTAAGCTEGEAMAAAELAARLMAEHGLSDDELVMSEARSRERTSTATWRSNLAATIAGVTNTAIILDGGSFLFIGRAPGPEIAAYLRDVCVRAVESELKAFKAGKYYRRRRAVRTRRAAAADFTIGMTQRLCVRIKQLFASQKDPKALAEAMRALAARFPDTVSLGGRTLKREAGEGFWAGWTAGDRLALNHGMSGDAGDRQLRLEHHGDPLCPGRA